MNGDIEAHKAHREFREWVDRNDARAPNLTGLSGAYDAVIADHADGSPLSRLFIDLRWHAFWEPDREGFEVMQAQALGRLGLDPNDPDVARVLRRFEAVR